MMNKYLYIVTNDVMLDYLNDNIDKILLQNYLVISNTEFKNKIDHRLKQVMYEDFKCILFDILDNSKINWEVIAFLNKKDYDIVMEHVIFLEIINHNIELL